MGASMVRRVWLFRAILVATPVLFLAVLELTLSLTHYGGAIDLVVPATLRDRNFLTLNRSIGKKYFGQTGLSIPEPTTVYFLPRKTPGRKRIICIGESTMQGFPYEFNATPAAFLGNRLRLMMQPEDSVEVINAGLSAVGSFVLVDFIRELVRYDPDLIVVYSGHNEFYGAFGASSSVTLRGPSWMTRLHIRLLHYRTYLLMRDAVARLQSLFGRPERVRGETLMEGMARHEMIPRHSATYNRALDDYHDNLEEMISIAHRADVTIMFSALVSNLRDQRPFLPDTAQAKGAFELGREDEARGLWEDARAAYIRARDGDGLRFRASSDFALELEQTCRERGVALAPVDSVFTSRSPHGLIGYSLILEHLHPNLTGYALMADTWAEAIRRRDLLGVPLAPLPAESDSLLRTADGITDFDRLIGKAKVDILTRRWPFVNGPPSEYRPDDPREAILVEAMRKGRSWSETRYQWADRLVKEGRWPEAKAEFLAVAKSLPWSFQPWVRLGDAAFAAGDPEEAEQGYRRALDAEESAHAHMKLATVLLTSGQLEDALSHLSAGLMPLAPVGDPLSLDEQAAGWYLSGVTSLRLRRLDDGKRALQRALTLRPGMREARELLDRLPRQ
jgi:hypothetical protein